MKGTRISAAFLLVIFLIVPVLAVAETVDELQAQIKQKQQQIERLQEQAKQYEANLRKKQQERRTLANQLDILSADVNRTQTKIETAQLTIEATNLQIDSLESSILSKETELGELKSSLAALLRYMARQRARSPIYTFFSSGNFSEFYTSLQRVQVLQARVGDVIDTVATVQATLQSERDAVTGKRDLLLEESDALANQRSRLEEQQNLKAYILSQTQSSEKKFATLLADAKREQEAANSVIAGLETTVRQRLRDQGVKDTGQAPALIWPVPKNTVTTLFRDLDYPFRHLFEHDAIDIRASNATTIRAPAAGYVAKVRTGNSKNYWYVVLVHDGDITTVYGHISRPLVSEGAFVTQGQPIALSGGLPNQPGSGPFSTGAHLHFEVRKKGIPVNPLSYLP